MTLDEAIRAAAKRGIISHLSLAPSHTGKVQTWMCGFRHVDSQGYICETAEDPVDAILQALGASKAKVRNAPPKPKQDIEDIL